jgi:pimeloyl-ACP methyl ester carboxylesterase
MADMPTTGGPREAYAERTIAFVAGDGKRGNVINVRGSTQPTRPPVLLVHGAGVRANIFRAPVETTLVDYLIARGHDVWLENWRASIDVPPNEWTLDQAAAFDHPAAVRTVVRETGCDAINAVIHCQGSTSFMMSAVAGLVPEVRTIVANAVSLHPAVPAFSRVKLDVAVPLVGLLTPYVNPHWGVDAPTPVAKMLTAMVKLTHHECDNTVCKMVSFVYGSGFPALWRHENINEATHEWLKNEFAEVPISFFRQMARCVRRGHLVAVDGLRELPDDFVAEAPRTDARFAFVAGALNRCFLPESQARTHAWFDRHRPGYHTLHVLPTYGHLDVFMGARAAHDTFPLIAAELEKDAEARRRSSGVRAGTDAPNALTPNALPSAPARPQA